MSCPCGNELPFERCCGPYLDGAPVPTAEALMRSRYCACVRNDIDYLMSTQAPDTLRPQDRESASRWARQATWLGLQVLAVRGGGAGDDEGEVEFVARFLQKGKPTSHAELSLFRRYDGVWKYVEGREPDRKAPARPKASPNEPCPCGSGKKFKRCHGAPGQA